jgi:hypothetical protein
MVNLIQVGVFSLGEHVRNDHRAALPDLVDVDPKASDLKKVLDLRSS